MENQLGLEKNVKNKIQNIKARLMVQKMQNNMNAMNEEKMRKDKKGLTMHKPNVLQMSKASLETDATEMSVVRTKNESCWQKFLDCLGLADIPENERFLKQ